MYMMFNVAILAGIVISVR